MMDDDTPHHLWNDPDGDGHNCVDCSPDSIWKCDKNAHPPELVNDPVARHNGWVDGVPACTDGADGVCWEHGWRLTPHNVEPADEPPTHTDFGTGQ